MRGQPLSSTDEELKTFMDARDGIRQGFVGTFDQLSDYLANL